jgi:hypothetical protein
MLWLFWHTATCVTEGLECNQDRKCCESLFCYEYTACIPEKFESIQSLRQREKNTIAAILRGARLIDVHL